MPEIIVPCPSCDASLLVDEQNAGHEVLCPGCNARLTLPASLDERTGPEAKLVPEIKGPGKEEPMRKNHPLLRTGHIGPLPETPETVPVPVQNRPAHLPERRGLSAEEEMRRLATLTTDPRSFDLHNVDTRGRTAFPCPGCNRPVWMARSDWGRVLNCGSCNQNVIAPDPSKGAPAQVVQSDGLPASRLRTVIPGRRQLENLPVGEQTTADSPKRQGDQFPPGRAPSPAGADRHSSRAPGIEPIPARGDVEMAPSLKKGPPGRKAVIPQEQAAAAAEFGDDNSVALAPSGEMVKPLQRLNPERVPNFKPKHEAELSVEVTENWGGDPAAAANSPAFRRTLTLAIITLGVGAILVTGFMLRSYFSPRDHTAPPVDENPTKNVEAAKVTLSHFFKAATTDEMAKDVRHPEKTLSRMQNFYTRGIPRQKMEFTSDWREQDNWAGGGVDFIFTTLSIDGTKTVPASLEVPKDGSAPRLDWESFVSWSDTPWSEFLKTTSDKPGDFRVTVTPIDYYNGFYSDRSRYYAFLVKDGANFGSCYAYCEVNSELGMKLLECVREARKSGQVTTTTGSEVEEGLARVILRLHFLPEGKKFNQAAIDGLVWNDWLEP